MQIVGKITGLLLTLIAILIFVLAACNTAFDNTIRATDTYADVLENEAIFEDLLTVALPAMMQAITPQHLQEADIDASESPVVLQDIIVALDADAWREVSELLLSPEWLQQRTDQLVNTVLEIGNGNLDVINEPFDLTDLRQRLSGDEAQQAAELIIDNASVCTPQQRQSMIAYIETETGQMPVCNPMDSASLTDDENLSDEELRAESLEVFVALFNEMSDALGSDTPTVGEFLDMNRDNARALNLMFELDRQGLLLLYLCPMALLALVVTFAIRSFKWFGRWIGLALIASGVGVVMLLLLTQVLAFNVVSGVLNANTELDLFLGRIASEAVRAGFANASGVMLTFVGIYIAIGFVLLVISWMATRDDDDEGEMVLIGEDGSIISTASQKRIGTVGDLKN